MAVVKLYDLARMTTATLGTGTITLGLAVAPYLSFNQAGVQNGDLVRYAIYDPVVGGSEIGTGIYTASGTTLTRNPTSSTNSNAAISLSGQAQVFITAGAADFFPTAGAATGDILYRNSSGQFVLLPIGVAGQSLGIASGIPKWGAGSYTKLTSTGSYYVNASASPAAGRDFSGAVTFGGGSDSTGNGSLAAPWQTSQHAYQTILNTIDANDNTINVYLAHGSSTNYAIVATSGPFIGTAAISFIGDSSDQSLVTIQAPPGIAALQIKDLTTLIVSYVTFADNPSLNGASLISLGVGSYGHLDINHCTLKSINTGIMIGVSYGGSVAITGPGMIINGNAGLALAVADGGVIDFAGQTVTVTGTPAFSTAFAYIVNNGAIDGVTNSTFSGSATGPKFLIYGNTTLGSFDPASVFPGSTAGLTTLANTPVSLTGTVTFADGSTWGASGFSIGGTGVVSTLYGGSNANQNFSLISTNNGSPSGDSITLKASSLFFSGFSGGASLVFNQNTLATGSLPAAGAGLKLYGQDGQTCGFQATAFGGAPGNNFTRYDGTAASPTGILANDVLMRLGVGGYDGTATAGNQGQILAKAFNSWVHSTDTSVFFTFITTPGGTTSSSEAMRINASGGLGVGTTTDPGIGNILVAGLYKSATAPTAVSGAGPILTGSASTLNSRMKVNLNGTDYWIPCSTTAF